MRGGEPRAWPAALGLAQIAADRDTTGAPRAATTCTGGAAEAKTLMYMAR